MSRLTRRLFVHGRVQGVGFRWQACAEAQRLKLGGWVRNRSDGSVEILLCGTEEAVHEFTVWAHHGPSQARVDRVICRDEPTTEEVLFPFSRKPSVMLHDPAQRQRPEGC